MILATHAVVGAAVASFFPKHPAIAFTAAFASHFLIDAIPHWHYPVRSFLIDKDNPMNNDMLINRYFPADLVKIGLDALLGVLSAYLVFNYFWRDPLNLVLLGSLGGILPDPLQFVYWRLRPKILEGLQKFHIWIHAKTDLDRRHLLGIASQIIFVTLVIFLVKIIR